MKIETVKDFKHWVRVELAKQDLVQGQLANILGLKEPYLSLFLNGRKKYGSIDFTDYIPKIVDFLHGNIADFKGIL